MADINSELKPSSVNKFWWLWERNPEMIAKYDYGNECGKWMMFWNIGPQLDDNWALARWLYNEGKLMGINSMKVGTMKGNLNPLVEPETVRMVRGMVGIERNAVIDYKNPDVIEAYREIGVEVGNHLKRDGTLKEGKKQAPIIFYCGPARNEALVMEYGNCLLRHIPYNSANGHIYYKTDAQTMMGRQATGHNHIHKIPLPSRSSR